MAKVEKRKDKDESFVPRLLGSGYIYTGSGSSPYYTMRDSAKR
jgi:hypothetical protein